MYGLNRQIIKMGKIYYILLNLSEKDVMQSELVCLYQTITQKIDQMIEIVTFFSKPIMFSIEIQSVKIYTSVGVAT